VADRLLADPAVVVMAAAQRVPPGLLVLERVGPARAWIYLVCSLAFQQLP